MTAAPAWTDGWYWSSDGLRLHWREIAATTPEAQARPVLLCIPGMTRTARDFEALGARLAGQWRVVAVDLRGRGDSAWARDSLTYMTFTYLLDLRRLLEMADIGRFVVLGSSLGGALAMQMAPGHRVKMAGVILNDIGPDIETAGFQRLRANVGRQGNWPTWVHAARDMAQRNADIYPDWELADWLAFAKRLCRLTPAGRIGFDYDPRIADPFRLPKTDDGADMWTAFAALAGLPVLSLRAERSDVLSRATQAVMARCLPEMTVVEVPGVGHAPSLSEPVAIAAVDRFLDDILRGEKA
jgi:pimeloyl-ACP methyl ester carboxylesterase